MNLAWKRKYLLFLNCVVLLTSPISVTVRCKALVVDAVPGTSRKLKVRQYGEGVEAEWSRHT